jgi:hypothetical protein
MTTPSLAALRDIHLPPLPALAWLPEWGVAAFAAGAALFAAGVWRARRRHARRQLRAALRELGRLDAAYARDGDATRFTRGLSRLLRRHAVTCFGGAGVASLCGAAWLQFLDARGGAGAFCQGPGAVLETRPYQSRGEIDAPALSALVRHWLKENPR